MSNLLKRLLNILNKKLQVDNFYWKTVHIKKHWSDEKTWLFLNKIMEAIGALIMTSNCERKRSYMRFGSVQPHFKARKAHPRALPCAYMEWIRQGAR